MCRWLKRCRLDLAFVTGLLFLAAVPLLVLRGSPLFLRPEVPLAALLILSGVVALWHVLALRRRQDENAGPPAPSGAGGWWQAFTSAALLGALAYVSFYLPMRMQFWSGLDEFVAMLTQPASRALQMAQEWDRNINRPLGFVPNLVGLCLAPDRIDGFLWLGFGLCWANGLALRALLREALPRARVLPTAAAALLIVNRAEPSRFFVMFTSNYYWTALLFLLAGTWLFLRSYRLGSRWLLALSCVLLGGSLCIYEAGYPLALLAPALAWLRREHRGRLAAWAYAWCGAVALFATRLLIYLAQTGSQSYQARLAAGAVHDPRVLWAHLWPHVEAAFSGLWPSGAVLDHWRSATWLLALAPAAVWIGAWRTSPPRAVRAGRYLVVIAGAALAVLLGLAPFIHMPPGAMRTQFFTAPGQATLLAGALCLAAGLLGRRAGGVVVTACVGLLAANAACESLSSQERARATTPYTFERVAHVYRQIHAVCPNPPPGALILLVQDDPTQSVFPASYPGVRMGERVLGASVVQVGADGRPVSSDGIDPVFHQKTVAVRNGEFVGYRGGDVPYARLLAFRVAADGTVSLLRRLPARLLPPDNEAGRYDPLALLRPGPAAELPFLRYPSWAESPGDLFDMPDGVLLGAGWGSLGWQDGRPSRRVLGAAEMVLNPLGRVGGGLRLDVEPDRPGRLEAVNEQDQVVDSAELAGRRPVVLAAVGDVSRASLLRLRVVGDGGALVPFRAYGPPCPAPRYTPPPDVFVGLRPGGRWYPRETQGAEAFRWVANDAEISPDAPAGGHIILDVDAPYGSDGSPCRLTLFDGAGKSLAAAAFGGRQQVRLAVPAGAGDVLRLHAVGVDITYPQLTEPLHFRVFHCELVPD